MRLAICVFALLFMLAPVRAQPPSPYQDLATELAAKIAASLPRGEQMALAFAPIEGADGPDRAWQRQVQIEMARALTGRGVRVTDGAATIVQVSCLENLRERACLAEIQRGTTRQAIAATRPLDRRVGHPVSLSLDVRPLFAQRTPILDAALTGDHLVVLDPQRLARYQRSDAGWQRLESQPIVTTRVWPRDVRGRLRAEGAAVEAFLPGVICRTRTDLAHLTCADERQPWPVGIENTGLEANRNYFHTPEGLAFFGAAPLGPDADARWLVAGSSGGLLFLDEARRTLASVASGDDVVALNAPCAGPVVLVASPGQGGRSDTLRVFRVFRRELVSAAAPVELPGRLTALWPAPGSNVATAVAHDTGVERYEAFQIGIACDR